jgi:outer membrane lipoprotein carrier protein
LLYAVSLHRKLDNMILSLRLTTVSICLLLLSSMTTLAQKNDAQAKKILDEVSTQFKSMKTVQANFTLKIENAAGKSLGSKTGMVYMKGTKYRVSITGQDIYSDGSNTWTFDKASNEVTINKLDPSANTITPQKLFTNFYDKDFLYKYNGEVKEDGKNVQEVELTPTDKSKPFFKVLVHISNKTIVSTKIFETAGNRITYKVSKFGAGSGVTDATFVFDAKKYPGVEIVDLR